MSVSYIITTFNVFTATIYNAFTGFPMEIYNGPMQIMENR